MRLVAFAALEPVLSTYDCLPSKPHSAYVEMSMWESALPYALKSTGKEYIASLLQTLTCFLGRLYVVESEQREDSTSNDQPLAMFSSFVNHFLIGTIFVKQAAYPGTVVEKEQFAVSLLRCVIRFAIQGEMMSTDRIVFPKPGQPSHLQSGVCEFATLRCITENLLSLDVLAAVVSLCHSIWDATRTEGFACLISLVQAATRIGMTLPHQFYDESVMARGVFLSSSPRQREADTGAMILAFTACARAQTAAQEGFLLEILSLLDDRIDKMRESLQEIMSLDSCDVVVIEKGRTLPLAHGLIQSVGLVIDATNNIYDSKFSQDTIVRLVDVCILSIQTSLSVVADVKDGETLEGMNSSERTSSVPLNVNTGAIGANATFSSIRFSAEKEALRRIATQRVVIGSWLLTREACATLTTLITYDPKYVPSPVVGRAGQLLITTMTALKHQGAAYAAPKGSSTSCNPLHVEGSFIGTPGVSCRVVRTTDA